MTRQPSIRKHLITERIKATNNKNETISVSSFNSIEDVIDTENLTQGLADNLNNLTQQSDLNDWSFSTQTFGYYNDSWKNSNKVLNKIVINKPETSRFDENYLLLACNDGEILIQNNYTLGIDNDLRWYYNDLTQQDIKQIAKYVFDLILSYVQHKPSKDKTSYMQSNARINTVIDIKQVLSAIEEACKVVTAKLPRGKQRSKVSSTNDNNGVTGTVIVGYRENASLPHETLCSFEVVKQANKDDKQLFDVVGFMHDAEGGSDEIGSTVVILDYENNVDLDEKFFEKCILDGYDDIFR